MTTLRFLFDVQCPYAYVASRRVEALAKAAHCDVEFFPVLLGGLYADTQAPQGKDGSASDVMAPNKRVITSRDLQREAERWRVPLVWNSKHPVRSVEPMRVLCRVHDLSQRARLAHVLFEQYWVADADVSDPRVIAACVSKSGAVLAASVDAGRDALKANTTWASQRGVFGVPTFFIMRNGKPSERFWHGQDRMFILARVLGMAPTHPLSNPLRLYPDTQQGRCIVDFYHDFASPWSYLGSTQVFNLAERAGATVRLKPILLGALFKAIGTPNVPMFAVSEAKRAYGGLDMTDFAQLHGVSLTFPKDFPLRTVLPLRVQIAEPACLPVLYKAAWVDGQNIGDAKVLQGVLTANGFDGAALVARANSDAALKSELARNTDEAQRLGVCGVPTYVVEGVGEPVWGQDRAHVVMDMIAVSKAQRMPPRPSKM